jgi:hypothetical protein
MITLSSFTSDDADMLLLEVVVVVVLTEAQPSIL